VIFIEESNYKHYTPFSIPNNVLSPLAALLQTIELHCESECGTELCYSIEVNYIVITPLYDSFTHNIISRCNLCFQSIKQQK
jgi:hypothetical protein